MCGINGIYMYGAFRAVDLDELIRTRDHMAARGPDGLGAWISLDKTIAFAHRRLAVIDLSANAAQPMVSADGRFVVTFNGEIYNYREIRRSLELRGHSFVSRSDTEVLLHLYAEKGPAMVSDLRGMFAFAIWSVEDKRLFIARDPYGIKPLYYSDDGGSFRFASQVRALLAGGAVERDLDPAGLVGFYLFGSVPEPFTSYRAIRALPAGSTLVVDCSGAREIRHYYSIAQTYTEARNCVAESAIRGQNVIELREALLDSVRHHLVADVSVGVFLSAGIDSGALVGLMCDAGQRDIQSVTLSFDEFRGHAEDEAPLANEVARHYATRHTTRVITKSEFDAELPRILSAMDQPSIDGINTWFVSKAARELGMKVAISGLGGDELFGGYPSFQDIPKWVRGLAIPSRLPYLGKLSRIIGARVAKALKANPKIAGLLELGGTYCGAYLVRRGLFMPWELDRLLDPDVVQAGLRRLEPLAYIEGHLRPTPGAPLDKVATLEASLYMRNQLLRDTDWASMAHSLEVRTPLVDSVLLRDVAAVGLSPNNLIAKRQLAMAPKQPLPQAVTRRKKTGFGTPIGRWISREQSSTRQSAFAEARRWARYVGVHHPAGGASADRLAAENAG